MTASYMREGHSLDSGNYSYCSEIIIQSLLTTQLWFSLLKGLRDWPAVGARVGGSFLLGQEGLEERKWCEMRECESDGLCVI